MGAVGLHRSHAVPETETPPLEEGIPPAVCSLCLSSEPASKSRHHTVQQGYKYKPVRLPVPKELAALHRLNALDKGTHADIPEA